MTVETRWSQLLVTDYFEHGLPHAPHRPRAGDHRLRRRRLVTFAPRPEFGQVPVRLRVEADGLRVSGTGDPIVLRSPGVEWEVSSDGMHETATATVTVSPGHPVVLELRCGTTDLDAVPGRGADQQGRSRQLLDRRGRPR